MRLTIRENPTFLRYHEIWRADPASIVFAPLAEMLILHKCYEEAITVCKKGLEKNPDIISGRIALARAYVGVSNYKRAGEEASTVLKQYPNHPEAIEILKISKGRVVSEEGFVGERDSVHEEAILPSSLDPTEDNRWNTVTMAEIFASQGNAAMARKIYNNVLKREPDNTVARERLSKLG